jgi:hypothetical protein
LNPSVVPLAHVVEEVERPVYVDLEALLALQEPAERPVEPTQEEPPPEQQPPEVDDPRGAASEASEEEVLAASQEGPSDPTAPSGEMEGEPGQAGAQDDGGAVETSGSYTVQVSKVVSGPRVRFTVANKPEGLSEEQMQAFLGSMKAGVKPRSKGKRGRCRTSNPDIHPKKDGTYDVRRSLVEHYTSSLKNFNSLGWSGPYKENGERGWKIGGFGCNSPLHFAGLRRGDIVKTVNGKKTNTWIQVFGAYQRLKHKEDFVVAVVRRGEPIELRYHLI